MPNKNSEQKNRRNFWPYGIMLSFVAIITACIVTVVLSLDYPVHMDNYYFDKYQNVERNYNEIQKSQELFESKFSVSLEDKNLSFDKPSSVKFIIMPKNSLTKTAVIDSKLLLTRADSNDYNSELNATIVDNSLITQNFTPKLPGRWQILMKLSDSTDKNAIAFYKFDLNATR